ncbi:MAG TPA: protein kinase [Kofleriaceae bacterium]|nr:protein kinase [Kofleriaceae bacterium]
MSVAADLGSLAAAFEPATPQELEAGTVIGDHFVLEQALGRGGMGVVYRALDRELDRRVAIKIGLGSTDLVRARREAIALARLAHPNVITIYEIGEHDGVPFVAMELCEGGTVRSWSRAAPRTWREILAVYLDAGRGLAAAHAAGLLHRDVKPDNILLGTDGRARIADFGLVRATAAATPRAGATMRALPPETVDTVDEHRPRAPRPPQPATANPSSPDALLTATGALVGTPRYMAPEQVAGKPLDARSDQFAFCIAFYESITGVDPFPPHPDERVVAMEAGRITPPRRERDVPRKVLAVVERGLSAAPAARFPTMDALLAALTRAARPRWKTLSPIAGALVVVVAVIVAAIASTRPPAERVIVETAARPTCASLPANLVPGWTPAARTAFIVGNPAAGESAHWAAEVIDHQARVLAAARASCKDVTERADRKGVLARAGGPICLADAGATIGEVIALRGQDPGQLTTAAGRVVEAAACAANLNTNAAAPDKVGPIREQIAEAERLARSGELDRAIALAEEARLAARTDGGESIITRAEFTLGSILEQQARRAGPLPPVVIELVEAPPSAIAVATITVERAASSAAGTVDATAVPALVSLEGELHAFVRSTTGTLLTARRSLDRAGTPAAWSPLRPLDSEDGAAPQTIAFDPAVIAADGRIEIFYRQPITGHLVHARQRRGGWLVRDRDGLLGRIATPVRTRDGRRLAFFTPDPSLYHWYDQRLWWTSTSADGEDIDWGLTPEHLVATTWPSAVASTHADRVDVVALDDRGHLSWQVRRGGAFVGRFIWRPEELPLGVAFEEPLIAMTADDASGVALSVVVRASDGQLWLAQKPHDATAFGALTLLGVRSDTRPALVSTEPGRFAVAGRDAGSMFVLDVRQTGERSVHVERTRISPALTGALGSGFAMVAGRGGVHAVAVAAGGDLRYAWIGR